MSDEERTVGWIDYVIASDDHRDKALADEFLASNWSHSQTMQWIFREAEMHGLTDEMIEQLEREMAAGHAIQQRIYARGQALEASGARPADAATAEAWHGRRRSLCLTLPSGKPLSRV